MDVRDGAVKADLPQNKQPTWQLGIRTSLAWVQVMDGGAVLGPNRLRMSLLP